MPRGGLVSTMLPLGKDVIVSIMWNPGFKSLAGLVLLSINQLIIYKYVCMKIVKCFPYSYGDEGPEFTLFTNRKGSRIALIALFACSTLANPAFAVDDVA